MSAWVLLRGLTHHEAWDLTVADVPMEETADERDARRDAAIGCLGRATVYVCDSPEEAIRRAKEREA